MSLPKTKSARTRARNAAYEQRVAKSQRRRRMLDLLAGGYTHPEIAERCRVSVATVRREVERALAEQQPPASAERYVEMQLARLNKALRVVDSAMEEDDLRAIPALATLLGEFDRYHGLAAVFARAGKLQKEAPKRLESNDPATELPVHFFGNVSPIAE